MNKKLDELIKKSFLKTLSLRYKLVVLGRTQIYGYRFREVKTLPIVGNHFYEGYEIINPNTNKVVYRKLKDYGYVSDRYDSFDYTITREFFKNNVI